MSPRNPQDLHPPPEPARRGRRSAEHHAQRGSRAISTTTTVNNFAPSVGFAWDPIGDGKQVVRGNYRMAYDRINTFVISSAILQSIPGITTGVDQHDLSASGRPPEQRARRSSRRSRRSTRCTPAVVGRHDARDRYRVPVAAHAWLGAQLPARSVQRQRSRSRLYRPHAREPLRRLRREPGGDLTTTASSTRSTPSRPAARAR